MDMASLVSGRREPLASCGTSVRSTRRRTTTTTTTTAATAASLLQAVTLFASLSLLAAGPYEATRSREYCHNEVFQASCPEGHVIMMESALYGRMSLGRCVKTDFGFVGCYADVLGVSERRCSARQECQIRIPDVNFDDKKPCNEDLKSYYEARFSCLPVVTAEESLCRGTKHLKAPSPRGYLASATTTKTSCGSHTSPWYIEGKPGQKVNITLLDYSENVHQNSESLACLRYASIRDVSTGRNIDVCGGTSKEKLVYTSVSNSVEIKLTGVDTFNFLIKYEVIGCADIPRPPNMWIKRKDDELLVGCPASGERWRLVCKANSWFGKIGNCSKETNEESERLMFGDVSFPVGVSILIIIVVALGIGGAILLVGLVMLRRRTRRRTRANAMKDVISMGEPHCDGGKNHDLLGGHHHHIAKMDCALQPTSLSSSATGSAPGRKSGDPRHLDNEYSYVWEGGESRAGTLKGTISKQSPAPVPFSADSPVAAAHICPAAGGLLDTTFTEISADLYGKIGGGGGTGSGLGGGGTSSFCRTHRDKPLAQYFELDPDVVPTPAPGSTTSATTTTSTLCPVGHLTTESILPTHVPCSECEQHLLDALKASPNPTVCAIHSQ